MKTGIELAFGSKPPQRFLDAVTDSPEEAAALGFRSNVQRKIAADLAAHGF